jgi:mannose-6-phosphate isomerase-like protein (cupin superfamily)
MNRGESWQGTTFEGLSRLPGPKGEAFVELFKRGTWSIELYAPRGDPQAPHQQDEIYVVVAGEGNFVAGKETYPFGVGDIIFVPAQVPHRFEDFTDDLAVWVIFAGPPGGDIPA